jgi:hypothetical protein
MQESEFTLIEQITADTHSYGINSQRRYTSIHRLDGSISLCAASDLLFLGSRTPSVSYKYSTCNDQFQGAQQGYSAHFSTDVTLQQLSNPVEACSIDTKTAGSCCDVPKYDDLFSSSSFRDPFHDDWSHW